MRSLADIPTGLIPFLGYHHVLMLLIAVAIILLCKYFLPRPFLHCLLTWSSNAISRLLIFIARYTQHLPHIPLLPTIYPRTINITNGLQRPHCNSQHRRWRKIISKSWILRNLHQPRWRILAMQQQCHSVSERSERGSRSAEFNLACKSI